MLYLSQTKFESKDAVAKVVDSLLESDDVLNEDFLTNTVVLPSKAASTAFASAIGSLVQISSTSWQVEHVLHLTKLSAASSIPSGPYVLLGSEMHQVWRLYEDTLDSFVTGVVPDDQRSSRYANANQRRQIL